MNNAEIEKKILQDQIFEKDCDIEAYKETIKIYENTIKKIKEEKKNLIETINNKAPVNKILVDGIIGLKKNNSQTNYALNKISNVRYVNGSNKHISKINYIRSPDIEFKFHEKDGKDILKGNNNINNNGERNVECIFDKNSK